MVIDMQGLLKTAIVSWLINSKVTLGFDWSSSRESMSSIFYNKTFQYGYDENIIERNFELIVFGLELEINKAEMQNCTSRPF
jgi:heptosyltransferase-1